MVEVLTRGGAQAPPHKKNSKIMKYKIELEYNDNSSIDFEVKFDEEESSSMAVLMMITKGTLMASMAERAIAYNDQGSYVCSFTK